MMTRPKVSPDKRQRIAQACEVCKRRKQKCNGKNPCNTCEKKSLECCYAQSEDGAGSRRRRRRDGNSETSSALTSPGGFPRPLAPAVDTFPPAINAHVLYHIDAHLRLAQSGHAAYNLDLEVLKDMGQITMVYDSTGFGRFLYLGDSSTLSLFTLVRSLIGERFQTIVDDLKATFDIVATAMPSPRAHVDLPCALPDSNDALVLARYFYIHTQGLIDVLDHQALRGMLAKCYSSSACPDSEMCLIYLVLAIGLIMQASPAPGNPYALRNCPPNRLEYAATLFRGAKSLANDHFEYTDGDLLSVQALALMTMYLVCSSHWNAAYSHIGTAVRSAFSLGIHRIQDTTVMYSAEARTLRCNIWRSLIILDALISSVLGRPTAIDSNTSGPVQSVSQEPTWPSAHYEALGAVAHSCAFIGRVLQKLYSGRNVSAQDGMRLLWEASRRTQMRKGRMDPLRLLRETLPHGEDYALLHTDLIETYSIILVTRPFFVSLLVRRLEACGGKPDTSGLTKAVQQLSASCVTASTRAIAVLHTARISIGLELTPFLMHLLFSAAVIIQSNASASLHEDTCYSASIDRATAVFRDHSVHGQGKRLLSILSSFQEVVEDYRGATAPRPATNPLPLDEEEMYDLEEGGSPGPGRSGASWPQGSSNSPETNCYPAGQSSRHAPEGNTELAPGGSHFTIPSEPQNPIFDPRAWDLVPRSSISPRVNGPAHATRDGVEDGVE